MNDMYKINFDIDVPIYQQLVDMIETSIKRGDIHYGEKLPTVQEMIDKLGVARGTVKKAYDELEIKGLIQKSQGKGTYVSYKQSGIGSRKEQAVSAIDSLFDELSKMGFSAAEINIFVNLKLRELAEVENLVKVAVVETSHEILSDLLDQIHSLAEVDIYTFSLENIEQYPYKIEDDFDIIITTPSLYPRLEAILPTSKKPVPIAVRPAISFLSQVMNMSKKARVGCLTYSESYGAKISETCMSYTHNTAFSEPVAVAVGDIVVAEYLSTIDTLIVPRRHDKLFPASILNVVKEFDGTVIEASYELDEGSILYLDRKIKKLYEAKNI